MNNKKRIIAAAVVLAAVFIAYQAYWSTPQNQKIKESQAVMKERDIEPTSEDKEVIKHISQDENVEYTYVTHDEESMLIRIKFKENVSSEKQSELSIKYLEEMMKKYPDKNINTSII